MMYQGLWTNDFLRTDEALSDDMRPEEIYLYGKGEKAQVL